MSVVVSTGALLATGALGACAHSEPPAAKAPLALAKAAAPPPPLPPLTLVPAPEARVALVATFVVPALDRSLSTGVSLVKAAAPLPLDPAAVRDMLLNQAGLPPEVAKHLDLGQPVAGASVVGGAGRGPLNAFCFGVRSPSDAAPLLAGLGRTISRRGEAVQIENSAGDRGWFWPQGSVMLFADSEEALSRAGSLALEARRAVSEDLVVAIDLAMLARAAGVELKDAVARFLADIEEPTLRSGSKLGPEATRQLQQMGEYVVDTKTVELALKLDVGRGAALVARLLPRAGSKLETITRHNKAVIVDPAVSAGVRNEKDGAGFVLLSSYGPAMLDQLRRQRGRLPATGGKPAAAAGKLLDTMIEGLTGELFMLGRARPALSGEIVYQARDAAGAARIQAALSATDKSALSALLRAATEGEGVDLKVQKARPVTFGKARGLSATIAVTSTGKEGPAAALRKLMGPTGIELYAVSIPGDRLAMAFGPGGRARIAALASGKNESRNESKNESDGRGAKDKATTKATTTTADKAETGGAGGAVLAAALGDVGARSLFYMLDLRQIIGAASAVGGDRRLAMLSAATAGAPIPIFGGVAGDGQGRTLTLDLILPPSAFAGIGGLVQAAAMLPRN